MKKIGERVRSEIFIVERDKMTEECDGKEKSLRPSELQDFLGYRFWVQDLKGEPPCTLGIPRADPNDSKYSSRINKLVFDLSEELKRLKKTATSPVVGPDTRPIVFLADVTYDLVDERERVKQYLHQAKIFLRAGHPDVHHAAFLFPFQAVPGAPPVAVQNEHMGKLHPLAGMDGAEKDAFPQNFFPPLFGGEFVQAVDGAAHRQDAVCSFIPIILEKEIQQPPPDSGGGFSSPACDP